MNEKQPPGVARLQARHCAKCPVLHKSLGRAEGSVRSVQQMGNLRPGAENGLPHLPGSTVGQSCWRRA